MLTSQQKRICDYFKKAVTTGTLRHSYIIKGDEGCGKTYALSRILKHFMCSSHSACGNCNGCKTIEAGSNPDIVMVSNGDKKTIEIQKIRDLIKEVYTKPISAQYKVFVIENAHLMGPAPQNALLKVIEEPPSYAVFILLCDNLNVILPTILSRVMLLEFAPTLTEELRQICPLDSKDEFMYNYALGNIGRLKNICENEEFLTLRDSTIAAFVKFVNADAYGVYEMSEFFNENSGSKEVMINILTLFLRDVVFLKSGLKENITNTDKIKEIEAVSARVTLKSTFGMLERFCDMPAMLGRSGNFNMLAHTLCIRLKEEIND